MKAKIQNFLDAPLTYRRCLKITGVCYLVMIPVYIVWMVKAGILDVKECWSGIKGFFCNLKGRFVK